MHTPKANHIATAARCTPRQAHGGLVRHFPAALCAAFSFVMTVVSGLFLFVLLPGLFMLSVATALPACGGGWGGVPSADAIAERLKPPADSDGFDLDALRKAAEESGGVPAEAPVPTQRDKAREKLDSAANAVGWLAGLCALASLATLILSFIVPIIPTKTSAGCFAAALVGYGLQYALLVYGVLFAEIAIWLGVVVLGGLGASVVIPYVLAARNWLQARTGAKLIAEGDPRAGVAMIAEAKALKPEKRKKLLASVAPSGGV